MDKFPHLKFSENLLGKARLIGGGSPHSMSTFNKKNRQEVSRTFLLKTNKLNEKWQEHIADRENQNLAPLADNIEPIFLKINPSLLEDLWFNLEKYQIEIISQEEGGYIIGASLDNLKTLEDKIRLFSENKRGGGGIADFWEIVEGNRENWRPEHILSPELLKKWNTISDIEIYRIEVAIAFDKPIPAEPDSTKRGGPKRVQKYKDKILERDKLLLDRQLHFENFVNYYGNLESSFVELGDSFACEVSINGKGLKDLVINSPLTDCLKQSKSV